MAGVTVTGSIRHTVRNESEEFAKKVGLRIPEGGALGDALPAFRDTYIEAMRAFQRGEIKGRMVTWTLPFLVRHTAFHTLDHAWEMEDGPHGRARRLRGSRRAYGRSMTRPSGTRWAPSA